jgi:hypothetical protein
LVGAGPAEQLGDEGARDVEALGREVVHLRVQLHPFPRDRLEPRSEAARGKEEHGQDQQCQQRQLPLQREHDDERHRDPDHVGDDGSQRARDRLLCADHVAVESRLQRTGLCAREERDRHVLDVVEQ